MNPIVYRKTGDQGDSLRAVLVSKSNRKRVDLTDCTAKLIVSQVLNSGSPLPLIDADATISAENVISYTWQEEDLPLAGVYLCNFRVVFPDSVEYFPKKGSIEVHVESSM